MKRSILGLHFSRILSGLTIPWAAYSLVKAFAAWLDKPSDFFWVWAILTIDLAGIAGSVYLMYLLTSAIKQQRKRYVEEVAEKLIDGDRESFNEWMEHQRIKWGTIHPIKKK